MKKILLVFFMSLPTYGWTAISDLPFSQGIKKIPLSFPVPSAPKTTTLEWGCPVAEVVDAYSGADAMNKIKLECIEEAKRAARQKPGVSDVIKVSVIAPDVLVSKHERGFYLKGTFFLETVVFQER